MKESLCLWYEGPLTKWGVGLISLRGVCYMLCPTGADSKSRVTQMGSGGAGLCVLQALAVARGGGLSAEEQSQTSNSFWTRVQQ